MDHSNSGKNRPVMISRRQFVRTTGAAATAAAVGFGNPAKAEELPRLDENDSMAKALNYVHDATALDASRRPADRFCNNCALYVGAADEEWAGCNLFPGKLVSGRGWCSAWAAKQPG